MSIPSVPERGNIHGPSLNGEVRSAKQAFHDQIAEINIAEKKGTVPIPLINDLVKLMNVVSKEDLESGFGKLSKKTIQQVLSLMKEKAASSSALSAAPSEPSSAKPILPSKPQEVAYSNGTAVVTMTTENAQKELEDLKRILRYNNDVPISLVRTSPSPSGGEFITTSGLKYQPGNSRKPFDSTGNMLIFEEEDVVTHKMVKIPVPKPISQDMYQVVKYRKLTSSSGEKIDFSPVCEASLSEAEKIIQEFQKNGQIVGFCHVDIKYDKGKEISRALKFSYWDSKANKVVHTTDVTPSSLAKFDGKFICESRNRKELPLRMMMHFDTVPGNLTKDFTLVTYKDLFPSSGSTDSHESKSDEK